MTEPAPEPEAVADDGADIPPFVSYSPSDVRLYVLGGVFVVASIVAVLTVFPAVEEGSTNGMVRAGAFLVIALAALWAMLAWEPTVVSVREGVLAVSRGSRTREADLRDPAVSVETSGNPSSPTSTVTVRQPDAKPIVIRGNQVRRRQFARIISYHQAHPHAEQEQ